MKQQLFLSAFLFTATLSAAKSAHSQTVENQFSPAPTGFIKLETIYSNRDLDAETVGAIKGRMNADASMTDTLKTVTVSSKDNVIYLNGEVNSAIEMSKVVDHAKSISPANRIVNQIAIKEPTPIVTVTTSPEVSPLSPPIAPPVVPPTPVALPESADEAPIIISQ